MVDYFAFIMRLEWATRALIAASNGAGPTGRMRVEASLTLKSRSSAEVKERSAQRRGRQPGAVVEPVKLPCCRCDFAIFLGIKEED